MEARAEYLGSVERPRLTVVKDGAATYSALPHVIMRDTSLSRDARLLYAILQGYAWQGGECRASHVTLAEEMGCSARMLRTYLTELISAGKVTEHDSGYRRQKVYRLVSIGTVLPIETVNENPASDSTAFNRKFPTVQSEISDTGNRKQGSDSKKKTPEKKKLEEEQATTLLDAASAAQPDAGASPKASREQRASRLPADWTLTEAHFEVAAKHGFDAARARLEGEKFSDHHRARGNRMLDWMAAWRTWIRNAVTFDARRQPYRNGAAPAPAPAGSSALREQTRQHSKWSDSHWDRVMGGAAMRGGPRDKGQPDGR